MRVHIVVMSESIPGKPNTITRRNSRGLLEVVCLHTGRILCIQSSEEDLFGTKWSRLVRIDTPEGPVYLEKGLNFDLTNHCKSMPFSSVLSGLVVDGVANGKSLLRVCEELNLDYRTICVWRRENEEFSEELSRAERDRTDYVREMIYEHGVRGSFEALKWSAEKGNPEKYGPRMKHSGDRDSPVSFILDTGIRREGDSGYERDVTEDSGVGVEDGLRGGEAPESEELGIIPDVVSDKGEKS